MSTSAARLLQSWQRAPEGVRHVVSVSLGSSRRNAREEVELLGRRVVLERIGTDGDTEAATEVFRRLDGQVDAFGLGGADLYVLADGRRYTFSNVRRLIAGVKETPVLDGSGLKNTLERQAVFDLAEVIDWPAERVLMAAAVDRFGMAEAIAETGAEVVYGDLIFGLNVNVPLRSIGSLRRVAHGVLPILCHLPQHWFYPTGDRQHESVEGKGTSYYEWATVLAGDTHYLKRYAPRDLTGKTVLTQTITKEDGDWMRERGVRRLITTTPKMGHRHFATNVLEALLVALSDEKGPLAPDEYLRLIRELGLRPQVQELS